MLEVAIFKVLEAIAMSVAILLPITLVLVLIALARAAKEEDETLGIDETHGDMPHMPQHIHDEKDAA